MFMSGKAAVEFRWERGTAVAAVPSARAVGVLPGRLLVLLSRVIGSAMSERHELHSFTAS